MVEGPRSLPVELEMVRIVMMLLVLLSTVSSWAQTLGTIGREVPDQIGIFQVESSVAPDLEVGDIVSVHRAGEKLGEATVMKVSDGRCLVSLKGVYQVLRGDEVVFERTAKRRAAAGPGQLLLDASLELLGQQVGRGECSDLADEAMRRSRTTLGQEVPMTEALAGDVLHFKAVKAKDWYTGPDHWAVVESRSGTLFTILHQNWKNEHKVVRGTLNLGTIQSGTVQVLRPRSR